MGKKRRLSSRLDLYAMQMIPAIISFLAIMVLIGFSWRAATQEISKTKQEIAEDRADYIDSSIQQKIDLYENALRAGSGLFMGSGEVTRGEWSSFVATLDITSRLPGAFGMGYSEFVPVPELNDYLDRMRRSGVPDFTITPKEPARDTYTSISYMEPMNERNNRALGVDMFTNPARRTAMERSRDTGQPSMSDVVPVLQEDNIRKNSFLIYAPVYKTSYIPGTLEQRREQIQGFVYSPLKANLLFERIYDDPGLDFNYIVSDASTSERNDVLYELHPDEPIDSYDWIKTSTLNMSDQEWTVQYGIREGAVPSAVRERPQNLLSGGTIFAACVAFIVYVLLQRRTRRLSEKEERQIQQAKDNLLSLASHQLRTPATGVKQYVGMVLEGYVGKIKPEQRELLNHAYESNERQLRIINEFLYLAKADAGRIILSPQRLDLVELTKRVIDEMRSEINESGHTVNVIRKPPKLMIYADAHSTRMIIENIVSNAIKYTPSGGDLSISFSSTLSDGVVSVKDNGVGIKKQDFGKLFKQFSRIPNPLTKSTAGSGIGLYLAQHLAKLNGGIITVESEPGNGSVFHASFKRRIVKNLTERPKEGP